jgi:uncharacterized iron-regulated membrane protein/ketosteroid isomerase-like protein
MRRAAFHVHRWVGVALGLYAFVIGGSGAVLMFRADLQAWAYPEVFAPSGAGGPIAGADTVLAAVEARYPRGTISGLDFPNPRRGSFLAYVVEAGQFRTVYLHPSTGQVMGELPRTGWIQRLQELHFNLLGGSTGEQVSRAGAWTLLVLAFSGLVIWWPGRVQWRRAFVVGTGAGWKRTMWELHRATGICVVALLVMWAVTGIHFTTPGLARRIIGAVAPLATPAPAVRVDAPMGGGRRPLSAFVADAQARWPGAGLARLLLPSSVQSAISVTVARHAHGDWDGSDEVTMWFDPVSGRLLRTDDASKAPAGERAVRWLGLVHVGTFGGGWLAKLAWSAGGLALAMLFATGCVMWWNKGTLRTMIRALRVVLIMSLTGLPLACGPAAVREEDVIAPLTAFYAAMKTGDKAAAMRPLAADAVFVESGKLETRAEYEANHLPADIQFESQVTGKRSPWQVKTQGDTAWVIATTDYDGTFDGSPVSFTSAQLAVLTRANGEWQIRSIHWSSRRR